MSDLIRQALKGALEVRAGRSQGGAPPAGLEESEQPRCFAPLWGPRSREQLVPPGAQGLRPTNAGTKIDLNVLDIGRGLEPQTAPAAPSL